MALLCDKEGEVGWRNSQHPEGCCLSGKQQSTVVLASEGAPVHRNRNEQSDGRSGMKLLGDAAQKKYTFFVWSDQVSFKKFMKSWSVSETIHQKKWANPSEDKNTRDIESVCGWKGKASSHMRPSEVEELEHVKVAEIDDERVGQKAGLGETTSHNMCCIKLCGRK